MCYYWVVYWSVKLNKIEDGKGEVIKFLFCRFFFVGFVRGFNENKDFFFFEIVIDLLSLIIFNNVLMFV